MMSSISIINYLKELKNNNSREWFNDHKADYSAARDAFETLTQRFIDLLQNEDELIYGVKPKECIFRIYRDVRFSKDKSPYKTQFGAYISRGGRKSELCGYYLHLEPGASMLAGGLHMPPSNILYEVRDAIYADPDDLKKIINAPSFKKDFGKIEGDKLKMAPKGFSKDFEDIDLLKYKSFTICYPLEDEQIGQNNFIAEGVVVFKKMKPFNDFFNRAILAMES